MSAHLLYTLAVTHPIFACHAASSAVRAVAGGNRIGSQPDHMGGGQDSGVCNSIAVMLLDSQQQGLGSARHLGRCAIIDPPCCAVSARKGTLHLFTSPHGASLSFLLLVSSKGWGLSGIWAGEASKASPLSLSLSESKNFKYCTCQKGIARLPFLPGQQPGLGAAGHLGSSTFSTIVYWYTCGERSFGNPAVLRENGAVSPWLVCSQGWPCLSGDPKPTVNNSTGKPIRQTQQAVYLRQCTN